MLNLYYCFSVFLAVASNKLINTRKVMECLLLLTIQSYGAFSSCMADQNSTGISTQKCSVRSQHKQRTNPKVIGHQSLDPS